MSQIRVRDSYGQLCDSIIKTVEYISTKDSFEHTESKQKTYGICPDGKTLRDSIISQQVCNELYSLPAPPDFSPWIQIRNCINDILFCYIVFVILRYFIFFIDFAKFQHYRSKKSTMNNTSGVATNCEAG